MYNCNCNNCNYNRSPLRILIFLRNFPIAIIPHHICDEVERKPKFRPHALGQRDGPELLRRIMRMIIDVTVN
jgi:hypothetical protein